MKENYQELIKSYGHLLTDNQHAMIKPYYFAKVCNYSVSIRDESYLMYANRRTLIEVYFGHPEYEANIKLYLP